MMHRLREAMRTGGLEPMGGEGKVVEADETYFGKTEEQPRVSAAQGRPYTKGGKLGQNNRPILALVERGGRVRTFHVAVADQATVAEIVRDNVEARKPPAYRRKQTLPSASARNLPHTRPSITLPRNTFAAT